MSISQRRAVAAALTGWLADGREAVLATVVRSSSSAPRGLGAQLAISDDCQTWVGGLTGGCAEVAVLDAARELLAENVNAAQQRATVTELTKDELGSVGPVCGATLEVLVERVDEDLANTLAWHVHLLASGHPARTVRNYSTFSRENAGTEALDEPTSGITWSGGHLEDAALPPPRMVVCGAGDVATELLRLAHQLGWRSCLVDPRAGFVRQTLDVIGHVDVVPASPNAAVADGSLALRADDACVTAAHDEKLDTPFLVEALRSDAFYVASVGSRVVQHARRAELESLVGAEAVARHHGPAGLDLGGSGAAEIALSIVAEAVAASNGRTGGSLHAAGHAIRAH